MDSSIIAKEVFDSKDLHLLNKNIKYTLVCNECRINSLPENVKVINADAFRIEGSWEAYRYNVSVLEGLYRKFGNSFNIYGFNIRSSVPKMAFWSNFKTGSIKLCLKVKFENADVDDHSRYFKDGFFKASIKYFRYFVKNNYKYYFNSTKSILKTPQARLGILVNDEFELILYKFLINGLRGRSLIIFHYGNIDFSRAGIDLEGISLYDLSMIEAFPSQRMINISQLKKDELNLANLIYSNWQEIGTELKRYEVILESGIDRLLINVGENLPLRNLMKEVFGSSIIVYNTMNGMKSGEAQDSDINFDKWFTWDKEMNDLLIKKCLIPENKLITIGHLSEDHIRHHSFGTSFKLDEEISRTKKIISIFSVRGIKSEKQDAFKVLYDILKEHDEYYLIVKPHPLEKESDYIYPELNLQNIIFVDEKLKNHKPSLYDILMLSDLSIVFGSTVALESKWIDTPCITFEYRDVSMIHDLDGKDIVHIRDKESLKNLILNLKKKRMPEGIVDRPYVSDNLISAFISGLEI